jgi:hypothetical protein
MPAEITWSDRMFRIAATCASFMRVRDTDASLLLFIDNRAIRTRGAVCQDVAVGRKGGGSSSRPIAVRVTSTTCRSSEAAMSSGRPAPVASCRTTNHRCATDPNECPSSSIGEVASHIHDALMMNGRMSTLLDFPSRVRVTNALGLSRIALSRVSSSSGGGIEVAGVNGASHSAEGRNGSSLVGPYGFGTSCAPVWVDIAVTRSSGSDPSSFGVRSDARPGSLPRRSFAVPDRGGEAITAGSGTRRAHLVPDSLAGDDSVSVGLDSAMTKDAHFMTAVIEGASRSTRHASQMSQPGGNCVLSAVATL